MTHILLERTRSSFGSPVPDQRSDFRMHVTESALPPKPVDSTLCPHCQQSMPPADRHAFQRFRLAVFQLLGAIGVIVWSVFRLARLAIAMVLSLLGFLDSDCKMWRLELPIRRTDDCYR